MNGGGGMAVRMLIMDMFGNRTDRNDDHVGFIQTVEGIITVYAEN